MIRLPATGIDISQNDLNFHLQQLDIYQGLLKQGFKKKEIIRYFNDKQAQNGEQGSQHGGSLTPAPSTFDLCTTSLYSTESELTASDSRNSSLNNNITSRDHSKQSPPVSPPTLNTNPASKSTSIEQRSKQHAPRQSSLLRYAHGISSESPPEEFNIKVPFSPRSNITYRPRSQTYSYDQSELGENDIAGIRTPVEELEHLSLDDELLPTSVESTRTTIRVVSNLRPEAEAFTPLYMRLKEEVNALVKEQNNGGSSSPTEQRSLPSSPPLPSQQLEGQNERSSPTLPPIPGVRSILRPKTPETAQRRMHQQYLDGSFTVYDDSRPARLQPQTPADLQRGNHFNEFNAAYTAPPGMIRTPMTGSRHGHNPRQPSGDMSPTARALLIRERRQREFARSAHIEGLRIGRMRDGANNREEEAAANAVDEANLWREDLDADSVGDENSEDATTMPTFRGIRAISGNRRVL
ncbi:hypothetical protein PMZ80_007553 [Knufia obscura]|uniref:Uncharacterized protein n=2 Tax=Knufia TaxID=430999 RepID=A0AAN8I664_9EURO|nr:hypothetical protein PMZ80_007553 [Knufia obscura]KAK5954094.1 hypothetical protein OHC33_004666 [Knufia fluminis]